ncbi:MAG TPA: alpha/beta hydrolase [Burkholderiales bacterium]
MSTLPDTAWVPDRLLPGFESADLPFPNDYDGPVVATLVRLPAPAKAATAVLYVHGFIDYFFQRHLAERFASQGYAFYALDLRKHGRSLRPHQHPNFCKSVEEYYADLDRALTLIAQPTVLLGHSTGGLLCALYAQEGVQRERIKALCLNSPFFDFNVSPMRRPQLGVAALLGRAFPFWNDPKSVSPAYPKSIHRDYRGEWDFDFALKPIEGFPAYFGWVGAIRRAQAKVHAGLSIPCPILSMHSDEADIVLNWRHIARWSRGLGKDVTIQAFPGGFHDLILSRADVRESVFTGLFAWLRPRT